MFKPLRDFIMISKDEQAKQTSGGLYVPATAEDKIATGDVLAVGSGRVGLNGEAIPLEVKVGDKVAFNRSMATEVKVAGETALLLREDQLLCIVS